MSNGRKESATDILLDIDARMSTLDKRVQNSENLLKILLSRLNTALSSGTSIQVQTQSQLPVSQPVPYVPSVVNKENFDSRQKTSKFAEAAAGLGLDVEDDINPIDPFEIDDSVKFVAKPMQSNNEDEDDMFEASSRGNSRGRSEARRPRVQSVLYLKV